MDIKDYLNINDRFAANSGASLSCVTADSATAQMTVTKEHLNAAGVCQGGAIFTLADFALAAVMNSGEYVTVGTGSSIDFLCSAEAGDVLTAIAVCDYSDTKLPYTTVKVYNQNNSLIAVMTGRGYRKKDRVLP